MHRRAGWHWSRGSSEVRRPTRTGTLGITVRVSLHRYHAACSRASAGWLQGRPVLLRFLPSRSARHGCSVSVVDCSGTSARSSTDRASDYGSEGWGFESLRARPGQTLCQCQLATTLWGRTAAKYSNRGSRAGSLAASVALVVAEPVA